MRKLNIIFEIINKENIILEDFNMNHTNVDGIYFKLPMLPPTIAIKKSLMNDSKKYISVLSEELGHHFTTTGDLLAKSKTYRDKLYKSKKELLARLWGANFLISDEEFVQALNDCIISISEMAEHFDVTEDIINLKIYSIIRDEQKYNTIRTNFMKREIQYNACQI